MFFRLAHIEYDFDAEKLVPRSRVFAEAVRRAGMRIYVLKGPIGYTNQFGLRVGNNPKAPRVHVAGIFRFEGLPSSQECATGKVRNLDDKMAVKKTLAKKKWPYAEGKTFWFWQSRSAKKYAQKIGYSLVVKPENGSVARHVTTHITNEKELQNALALAWQLSPVAIVERYVEGFVHRVTVIAGKHVFCVKQLPAHVVGDGAHTVQELIDKKNKEPMRGSVGDSTFLMHPIVLGPETALLLNKSGQSLAGVPASGKRVYLRREPFMRYGGDLEECTDLLHPDNKKLALDLAREFSAFLVGIDLLIPDITCSWKEQTCAVLELNSLPSIDMHHFPYYGTSRDVAGILLSETLQKIAAK